MTIGICTRYSRHEATAVALRIVQWTQQAGLDSSLFTMTQQRVPVDVRWDNDVIYDKPHQRFTDWVTSQSCVVWTSVPHPAQIHWAKQLGKRTCIVVLWHYLEMPYDMASLHAVDQLIVPTQACYQHLHQLGLRNLHYCPWDCGNPRFRKSTTHDIQPKILVPLWDGNARRTEMTLVDLIARAVNRHSDATFTIAYSNSSLRPRALKRFKQLKHCYPNQIILKCRIPPVQRPILFQNHDLTLWPTHFESLNLVGLMSITAGTPIMAFKFLPTEEILTDTNSIEVTPTAVDLTAQGLPIVKPNYELMDQLLHNVLSDHDYIKQLQQTVGESVPSRRNEFNTQMTHCFQQT